jgi:effector-binding domain-containing protein
MIVKEKIIMPEKDIMKIGAGEQLSRPALSIKAKVPEKDLPDHVEKSYRKIISCLNEQGEKPDGAPFIAYYNIDTQNLRGSGIWDMEVGFPVSRALPGKDEVKSTEILKGKTVSCMYKGAYRDLGTAYSKLTEWINGNKYQSLNISYEYFYNSPADVPEEELLTEIVLLVK